MKRRMLSLPPPIIRASLILDIRYRSTVRRLRLARRTAITTVEFMCT